MTLPVSAEVSAASAESVRLEEILDRVERCLERISLGFDRWSDPLARGPGLYVIVERDSVAGFTEPMGSNRWPVEDCASVFGSDDALYETARSVATACDGAVVVDGEGAIEERMFRIEQPARSESGPRGSLPFADWMGARHMSALETSTRESVFAAVTLSEEDGRLTVFRDGTFEDHPRDALDGEWRVGDTGD